MNNEINIRAGLIYDLYKEKISSKSLLEIINYSKLCELIKEFEKLNNIINIINSTPENELNHPCDDLIGEFRHIKTYAENYLFDNIKYSTGINVDNITQVDIHSIIRYIERSPMSRNFKINRFNDQEDSLDKYGIYHFETSFNNTCNYDDFIRYIAEYSRKMNIINNAINIYKHQNKLNLLNNKISLEPPKFNFNTKGHKTEYKILTQLKEMGFNIEKPPHLSINITNDIILSGRPDGYIKESPVKDYENIYVEIKNKSYDKIRKHEELQLYTYYKLTKSPILLITCWKKKVEFRVYSRMELKRGWKVIKTRLIQNVNRLSNLIKIDNIEKYKRLTKLLNDSIVEF